MKKEIIDLTLDEKESIIGSLMEIQRAYLSSAMACSNITMNLLGLEPRIDSNGASFLLTEMELLTIPEENLSEEELSIRNKLLKLIPDEWCSKEELKLKKSVS